MDNRIDGNFEKVDSRILQLNLDNAMPYWRFVV